MNSSDNKYYAVVCAKNDVKIGSYHIFGETRIYGVTNNRGIAHNYANQFPTIKTMGVIKIDKKMYKRLLDNDVSEIYDMGEYSFTDYEYEMICEIYGGWETMDYRNMHSDLKLDLEYLHKGALTPTEYHIMENSIKYNFEVFKSKKIKKLYKRLLKIIKSRRLSRRDYSKALKINDVLYELAKDSLDMFDEETLEESKLVFQRLCIHGYRYRS